MTLMNEINTLRKELEDVQRKQSKKAAEAEAAAQAETGDAEEQLEGFAALLHEVDSVIDEFGQEIDKFPRITALTALTVGLALGFVIGRHIR